MEAMEYLHSYYSDSSTSYQLGWDSRHRLKFLDDDPMSYMGMVMEGNYHPPLLSTSEADFSTGYLEDALVEFSQQYKRRRLLFYAHPQDGESFSDHSNLQTSFWNSNCQMGFNGFSDEEPISSSMNRILSEVKASEDEEDPDSPSSSYKLDDDHPATHFISDRKSPFSANPVSLSGEVGKRKKKVVGGGSRRVAYPFAVVKPGGVEGEVTLKEINDRILMPPTRPVRHPVGAFACSPCVLSDGVGLSGKAVVALTRIQTHGRGTITIIRTKG